MLRVSVNVVWGLRGAEGGCETVARVRIDGTTRDTQDDFEIDVASDLWHVSRSGRQRDGAFIAAVETVRIGGERKVNAPGVERRNKRSTRAWLFNSPVSSTRA